MGNAFSAIKEQVTDGPQSDFNAALLSMERLKSLGDIEEFVRGYAEIVFAQDHYGDVPINTLTDANVVVQRNITVVLDMTHPSSREVWEQALKNL